MTGKQAAEMLDLSLRYDRRLLARYRLEGAAALAHWNRGRASPCRVPEFTRVKVMIKQDAIGLLQIHSIVRFI